MSDVVNPFVSTETAAERIIREKGLKGYAFAPGITIAPPSQRTADRMNAVMEEMGENPSESDVMAILSVLLGDQFDAVVDYLETCPIDVYPALFADLFENILAMIPQVGFDYDAWSEEQQDKWRALRPDIFSTETDG